ncbi:MAG TPA: YceI family protein [Solirubrobacteraceae bacterium]|nr:YceI family protein [Solirubrobacteraceae bacterium]
MSTEPAGSADVSSIEQTRWRIDPSRSRVEFQVKTYWGLMTVKGHFERYTGTLDLTANPAVELIIESGSLDTKNKMRDKHLRSADFFDVEQHPNVRFVSDSATLADERLKVRGRLHARGESMPLELEAKLRRVGDELELEAATEDDYHQLGMTWNRMGMLRTPGKLIVEGRLVEDT